jgi:hypothetical protein
LSEALRINAVGQIWADHKLKPWKIDTFTTSNVLALREEAGQRG